MIVARSSPSARAVALDVLDEVLERRWPLEDAFEADTDHARLAGRDRAFSRNLVATTLRRLGQIDALIDSCLERPLQAHARAVRQVLRLGVCQLVFLATPAHAAVATSVALVEARAGTTFKGVVNAVLRRLAREGHEMAARQDAPRLDTPAWLWRSWTEAYGETVCRRIAEAHLVAPPLDLSVAGDAEPWARRLDGRVLPTGSLRITPRVPIVELPGYARGAWWIQDAAAALPARLLGPVKGLTVIDLCAAPGGKTAQIALAGANVIAVDRARGRLARLRENLSRLRLKAEIVAADALAWRPDRPADAVLLDAPCSATGTIRRHPDVAWTKQPTDVANLAAAQQGLLVAALTMVRPGGTVVYCACSLQPEEGPRVVDRLLASGAAAERMPITAADVGGLAEPITARGELRTLPCQMAGEGGWDGFFAARLRRR